MTITKNDMSLAEATDRYYYNPETGLLHHARAKGRNRRRAGDIAGSVSSNTGYVVVRVGEPWNRQFMAHRLAWLLIHGRWPLVEIDHINGVKHDNRLVNLREATIVQNNYNNGGYREKALKGAYQNSKGIWYAAIRKNKKLHYLGYFQSEIDAHDAYCRTARTVAGEFARFD